MLKITVPESQFLDESASLYGSIITIPETTLTLEHSLVSISKWERKWHKAFLGKQEKTQEEMLDYIKCMTITQNVNPLVYSALSKDNIDAINAYIEDPMTATHFYTKDEGSNNEVITAEIIYYWMISYGIWSECQKWHLNSLLTLIRVCGIKNAPPKKMSSAEIMSRNAKLNAERKAKMNSRG